MAASCKLHKTQELEFNCQKHNVTICKYCKLVLHSGCEIADMRPLCENSTDDKDTANSELLLTRLAIQARTAQETTAKTKETNRNIKAELQDRRHTLDRLREEVIRLFESYEARLAEYEEECKVALETVIETCDSITRQVEEEVGKIEQTEEEAGIALRQAGQMSSEFERIIKKMKANDMHVETNILDRMSNTEHMSEIIEKFTSFFSGGRDNCADKEQQTSDKSTEQHPLSETRTFWKLKPTLCLTKEVDLKTRSDQYTPVITGSCILPDGQVLLCDNSNSKLKILDKDANPKYDLPMDGKPFDVAVQDENTVLVSLPPKKWLQLVAIQPGFKKMDNHINVGNCCYGIDFRNNNIYACVYNTEPQHYSNTSYKCITFCGIKIFSKSGQELVKICHVGLGQPQYLTVSADGSKIFYTGKSVKDAFVTCMTKSEHGIFKYAGKMLSDPRNLIVDSEENLLVCDHGSRVLLALNSDGLHCKCLLTEKQMLGRPVSVCCDIERNILLIATADSCGNGSVLKVFTCNLNDSERKSNTWQMA